MAVGVSVGVGVNDDVGVDVGRFVGVGVSVLSLNPPPMKPIWAKKDVPSATSVKPGCPLQVMIE